MVVSINWVDQKDDFQWKVQLKWMIWGYPHFRKPPYIHNMCYNSLCSDIFTTYDGVLCVLSLI